MSAIGELNEDGTIKTEADEDAITGKIVLGEHHAVHRIAGTRFFFRVLSDYEHLLSPQKRKEIEALVEQVEAPVKRKGKSSDDNPIDANPV